MNSIEKTDDRIKQIVNEMEFEHLNNMDIYTEDQRSIDFMMAYKEEDWSKETNIIINAEHALINLSKSYLNSFIRDSIIHKKIAYDNFLISSAYGFVCYLYVKTINRCIESGDIMPLDVDAAFHFPDITRFLSQLQICKWWEKANPLGTDILNSINNHGLDSFEITNNGVRVNPISWFIVDLFSVSEGRWYINKNARRPSKKEYKVYQKALNLWDSSNTDEVENIIYDLCESHLNEIKNKPIYGKKMGAILSGSIDQAIEIITDISIHSKFEDVAPRDLDETSVKIFPYEVFSWLSVREKFRLDNPKRFSHPLMNTALTSEFTIKDNQYPETNAASYVIKNIYNICPLVSEVLAVKS